MRYSRVFGKTQRTAKRDMKFSSHKLLYRGGFVRELSAGRYEFLPLGFRVWQKIVDLIDEEMRNIGSQRVSIPILQPIEYWKKTNRDEAWGESLMKVKDRNDMEFALSATGEGIITEMIADTQPTYKDLPIIVHQFIIKLRDELRPRGGLIRVREFVMKDAYSYHESEEGLMKTYRIFYDAYSRICEKLELDHYPVIADSGALGGDYCHEFQIPCEIGEDTIIKCSKCDYVANVEKAEFVREEVNKDEKLKKQKIIKQDWDKARSIKEMVEFFGKPANNMIKSVMYKAPSGKLIIAIVAGNLDVNPIKLASAVGVSVLEKADEEDFKNIGATPGALHAWGYEKDKDKITFVADFSIVKAKNLLGGYKTRTTDPMYSNYGRDFSADVEADIADPSYEAICVKCGGKLERIRAIEFGHIFKYDTFYSKHHGGHYIGKSGQKKLMYSGAYGIGIGRAMAIVVEKHHDERGIIWPRVIAPFDAHLVQLDDAKNAEGVYIKLKDAGIDVLWDDRDVSAGEKFADCDLIGIPYRLVVSDKTGEKVELKKRDSNKTELLTINEILIRLKRK
ncbi:proline--tRNA ligase [Patescibacteria group bacterium]